jgi:hypothetical protein
VAAAINPEGSVSMNTMVLPDETDVQLVGRENPSEAITGVVLRA